MNLNSGEDWSQKLAHCPVKEYDKIRDLKSNFSSLTNGAKADAGFLGLRQSNLEVVKESKPLKISVVGNIAGGKTRLSRSLASRYNLPLTHVDSIQFTSLLKIHPYQQTSKILSEIALTESWLIDGYGPLNILEQRFAKSHVIVFIDLPLWRHQFWCFKRQVTNIFFPRTELPNGSNEVSFQHTKKLFKTMISSHRQMRPELLKIFSRETIVHKVLHVRSLKELKELELRGLPIGFGF